MGDYLIEAPVDAIDEDGNFISRGWYAVPKGVFDEYWLYRNQNKKKLAVLKKLHDLSRGCLAGIEEKPDYKFKKINEMCDILEDYF